MAFLVLVASLVPLGVIVDIMGFLFESDNTTIMLASFQQAPLISKLTCTPPFQSDPHEHRVPIRFHSNRDRSSLTHTKHVITHTHTPTGRQHSLLSSSIDYIDELRGTLPTEVFSLPVLERM